MHNSCRRAVSMPTSTANRHNGIKSRVVACTLAISQELYVFLVFSSAGAGNGRALPMVNSPIGIVAREAGLSP